MKNSNHSSSELIHTICNSFDGYPLSEVQEQTLAEFRQTNALTDLSIDSPMHKEIAEAEGELEQLWPQVEMKIKEALYADEGASQAPKAIVRRSFPYRVIGIAASILLLSFLIYQYFIVNHTSSGTSAYSENNKQEIQPGGPKATLILSDNSAIRLEEQQEGVLATQGGTSIKKVDSGELAYETISLNKRKEPFVNTLITPRAGTFKVRLPDRTVMYLNAESSVSYPATFDGASREVTLLKGEVYFDVAHSNKPFIVRTDIYQIQVLGTEFNINSYSNEPMSRATLVNGSVRLISGDKNYILKPRQQAVMSQTGEGVEILNNVNIDAATLWKDGFFSFNQLNIKAIMKQVERWYDVTVIYEDELEPDPITVSKIPRSYTLEKFLEILSEGGRFHHNITGNREVIIKK